jgi:poly(glycerol-phosphate) alpha-glucosyltransferase
MVTGSLYNNASGPFTALKSLVSALTAEGENITILGSKDTYKQSSDVAGWNVQKIAALPKLGPYHLHFTPSLIRHLNNLDFTLAHFQSLWLWNCATAARFCFKKKIPYVITMHGNLNPTALQISKLKKRIVYPLFVKDYLQKANCLHALNMAEYDSIRAFGLRQPVCVIPNGVDLPSMTHPLKSTPNPHIAHLRPKKVLLYLARLHPIKNLEGLISAWALLSEDARTAWQLVIAGSGDKSYQDALHQLVSEKNLSKQIDFVGLISETEKYGWLSNADAFILPSHGEGLPMGPLEAMAHRLPCLLTHSCKLPEVAQCGAGLEFGTSPDNIASALTLFFSLTDKERSQMGQKGTTLVYENFSWRKIAQELRSVYGWLLGLNPAPECIKFK